MAEEALRASVCVERTLGIPAFRQWITLREGAQADRIDLVNDIDWQSNALLKAEFPLSVSNPEAVYMTLAWAPYAGGAPRPPTRSMRSSGRPHRRGRQIRVSVLNDSKYGWDKPADNTLRLRCCIRLRPRAATPTRTSRTSDTIRSPTRS